jgi:hypothetical protein
LYREIHGGIHGRDETDASLNALLQREACKSRAQYARNNIKAISAHYREESKRLDGELIKAKEGKANVDLTVYGYTKPKTPRDPRRPT